MQRLLVIGPCGAGKSTLSAVLCKKIGLPVFHMDQFNWRPRWVEISKEEIGARLADIVTTKRWMDSL